MRAVSLNGETLFSVYYAPDDRASRYPDIKWEVSRDFYSLAEYGTVRCAFTTLPNGKKGVRFITVGGMEDGIYFIHNDRRVKIKLISKRRV